MFGLQPVQTGYPVNRLPAYSLQTGQFGTAGPMIRIYCAVRDVASSAQCRSVS